MADVIDFEKALQRKKQKIKQSLTDTTDLLDRSFTDDELVDVAQFDKNIEKDLIRLKMWQLMLHHLQSLV